MALEVIILAAGKGTRMCSAKPKVLHEIAGKPLLRHVIETSLELQAEKIHIVYGHGGKQVRAAIDINEPLINWVEQTAQLGTGHAVLQALPFVEESSDILVLYGDVPLLSTYTLNKLIDKIRQSDLVLLTALLDNPFGLGRIIVEDDKILGIVEEKDASVLQKEIKEINSGVMLTKAALLKTWLPRLDSNNNQGELYLTDIVKMAVDDELKIDKLVVSDPMEVQGVNDLIQLEQVERNYQLNQIEHLMRNGVTVRDKNRVDIRGSVSCGFDVSIDINVIFEGDVIIEDGVSIGANCIIKNSTIKQGAQIHDNSMIDESIVGQGAQVGPFARLRPNSHLGENAKVGNFVEMKKTTLGDGSKVNHLSYIGDATIGSHVNVGAGTITCNYDGVNKHKTIIEDGAFIGSGTQLVAPIQVRMNATIGAGTTLRKEAIADALTLTRSEQVTITSWVRKTKKE